MRNIQIDIDHRQIATFAPGTVQRRFNSIRLKHLRPGLAGQFCGLSQRRARNASEQ
jgi:hypothetical protein